MSIRDDIELDAWLDELEMMREIKECKWLHDVAEYDRAVMLEDE